MTPDETSACWAALVALVDDVHAPQDQLTLEQWSAAETLCAQLDRQATLEGDGRILFVALAVMLDLIDCPDMPEPWWTNAEQLRDRYDQLAHQTAAA